MCVPQTSSRRPHPPRRPARGPAGSPCLPSPRAQINWNEFIRDTWTPYVERKKAMKAYEEDYVRTLPPVDAFLCLLRPRARGPPTARRRLRFGG